MTVPQCVNAPNERWAHGANEWHRVLIIVTITVIVTACAGLTPDWITAAATLLAASAAPSRR
ncbi:hypothetical protein ACFTXM_17640 [Streptomyces sp. NPDC056930]|uniref:hypothetical protein n=1 Tax=Streptomyces sp. NPDC056930 TaxID=3345967 RepID=UPI0036271ABA